MKNSLGAMDTEENGRYPPSQKDIVINMDLTNVDEKLIEEHNEGLKDIEQQLSDLVEITNDISHQTNAQGEDIKGIETKTKTAEANVDAAIDQQHKASILQCSARKKIILIVAIVLIIVIIVIAVPTAILTR
eukprot:TRINITY_DN11325_c0_g1_i1.p1 TRINITY_DN11325_c0_g1~~TRINITY_DN11325_c0_g1_i1.p1  ORF type:complete len:132 (+),score=23.47 TRINITY_DN11325_c0_g1_i1:1-396(+)